MQRAKRLLVAIMICVLAAISVTLVACNNQASHDYVWKFDANQHWKECAQQDCKEEEEGTRANHNLVGGKCEECGYEKKPAPHQHNFVGAYVAVDRTYHARKCANDNSIDLDHKEEHTFPAEDNEDGLDVNKCTRCGYEKPGVNHIHKMIRILETKATCVEQGVATHYECDDCGNLFADREGDTEIEDIEELYTGIDPTNHNVIVLDAKEPTCSTIGYDAHKECTWCHKYFEDKKATREVDRTEIDIDALGHTITDQYHEYRESTCEEDGNLEYWTCDVCGDNLVDDSGDWDTEVYENVVIPAIGHDLVPHSRREATCEEEGKKAYYSCLNGCGKLFVDSVGNIEVEDENELKIDIVPEAHTFSEKWSTNAEYHWYDAVCIHGHHEGEQIIGEANDRDGCETPHVIKDKVAHIFPAEGTYDDPELALGCTICGYVKPYRTAFTYELVEDMDAEYNEYYGYAVTGFAEDATEDEKTGEIEFPSVYRGLPVIRIADEAFKGNTDITRITIPGSVMRIGKSAFADCSNLAWIELNEGVRLIDHYAFQNCTSLPGVIFPDSMDGIGQFAFAGFSGWIVLGRWETWHGFPDAEKQMGAINNTVEAIIQDRAFGVNIRIFLKEGVISWYYTVDGEINPKLTGLVYSSSSNPAFIAHTANRYYSYFPLNPGEGNKEQLWGYNENGVPAHWPRYNDNGDQIE